MPTRTCASLLGPGAPTLILCLGVHPARIMLRTVLPNVLPPLVVQFSLTLAAALVIESCLSFLGLGVVPPMPSWGLMFRGAHSTMDQAPLLLVWPRRRCSVARERSDRS